MPTELTLSYSPCPNDCFIFDALVNNKIDTGNYKFNVQLDDVETLNQRAFKTEPDISKLSFHALLHLNNTYNMLDSGAALGFGCGPLLISKKNPSEININDKTHIAIPGRYTTANLLFSFAYPEAKNKTEMLFSEIEDAVLNDKADAGLIIHENRFTYEKKGLKKIIDLGQFWENSTNSPIPLGCIAIKRSLGKQVWNDVNHLIRTSVEYAFLHPESSMGYVKQHAREMDEEVIKKHIGLYVNKYSINLGETGHKAVDNLFAKAKELNLLLSNSII